jgi:NAD(P)-dependent dehydrogenase (short-subunit alcohol dehydrogenase family)
LLISTEVLTTHIPFHLKQASSQANDYVEKANDVANAINSASPNRAIAVVGDILDDKYITTLVEKAAQFGNGKIHIIVNNAGFTWDGVIHKVCAPLVLVACSTKRWTDADACFDGMV